MSDAIGKQPSLRQVAASAKVSVCTASKALRGTGRISERTRRKVIATAEAMGYKIDPFLAGAFTRVRARGQGGGHGAIGVLLATETPAVLDSEEGMRCLEGIREAAGEYGYGVDEFFPDRDYAGSPGRLLSVLQARGLTGVIFVENLHSIFLGATMTKLLRELAGVMPVVFAGRNDSPTPGALHVDFDRFSSGFCCLEMAHDSGYRRPGILTAMGRLSEDDEFVAGCAKAQKRFVSPGNAVGTFCIDSADPRSIEGFRDWVRRRNVDVILCNVRGLYRGIVEKEIAKLQIPMICGEMMEGSWPGIPGVEVDWKTIGMTAAEALFNRTRKSRLEEAPTGSRLLVSGRLRPVVKIEGGKRPEPAFLDLAEHCNSSADVPGGWFLHHPLPLRGEEVIHGSGGDFLLTRERAEGDVRVVLLRSRSVAGGLAPASRPREVVMALPGDSRKGGKLRLLLGCGFAGRGAHAGSIELVTGKGRPVNCRNLISGGRPRPPAGSNIQDWWPHYPLLPHAVPVYANEDRNYYGVLYEVTIDVPPSSLPLRCRLRGNSRTLTTLALVAGTLTRQPG